MADTESKAIWNVNDILMKLLAELNSSDYQLFLTGKSNFRYDVFPEYKIARAKVLKPQHLETVRQHLMTEWKANMSEGCEADDMLGIEQTRYSELGMESMIVSIDKDLNTVPGWHYNPKHKKQYIVSPNDAIKFFYTQLLTGDSADGIKGAPGVGKVKAPGIIADCITGREHYEAVKDYYPCEESLELNAVCLYIWRQPNDDWKRVMLND